MGFTRETKKRIVIFFSLLVLGGLLYFTLSNFSNVNTPKKKVRFTRPVAPVLPSEVITDKNKMPYCHNTVLNPSDYQRILEQILREAPRDILSSEMEYYNKSLSELTTKKYTDTGLVSMCNKASVGNIMKFIMSRIPSKKGEFTFFDEKIHTFGPGPNKENPPKEIEKLLVNFTLMNMKRSVSTNVNAVLMKTNNELLLLDIRTSMGDVHAYSTDVPDTPESNAISWIAGGHIAEQGFNEMGAQDPNGYYVEGGIPKTFENLVFEK